METDAEVKYPLKMRSIRLPILILGLNGVPGFAIFRHFNKLYGTSGVIGIRPIKHPCVFGDNVFAVDAEETERLRELLNVSTSAPSLTRAETAPLKHANATPPAAAS